MLPTQRNSSCWRVAPVAVVREIEQACFAKVASTQVMVAAGAAVAEFAKAMPGPLLCVAGAGNNGGDALVVARLLHEAGMLASAWLPLGRPIAGGDAAKALAELEKAGGTILATTPMWEDYAGVVDGLFGIGLSRDLTGEAATIVDQVNHGGLPVLSIDVPSGIDADTGLLRGSAVKAVRTVTFFTHKLGLLVGAGKEHAGEVHVRDLGHADLVGERGGVCFDSPSGITALRRKEDAHKGCHGTLALVGGAPGMAGALALASRAAVAHGAGKVFAVSLDDNPPGFDTLAPEVMWHRQLPAQLDGIAFGPGAGTAPASASRLRVALSRNVPLVVDADGLNLLAEHAWLRAELSSDTSPRIFTPHPAEAGRLLDLPTKTVNADRVGMATRLARELDGIVVLKGSGTVVAAPSGKWGIVAAGNPGLAQAGSGDVLTGIIGALLVQGLSAWDAAASGAWLHAAGADVIQLRHGGSLGLALADITQMSSRLLAQLVAA